MVDIVLALHDMHIVHNVHVHACIEALSYAC